LAKSLIDPNIKSYHLFRKTRTQRVYRLLKEYRNRRILSILFAKLLLGKKVKLIVDGTILEVANLNRARTQGIRVMVVCDSEGIVYDLWFHPAEKVP
ncbi:MAG: hypothetical protein ACO2O3_16120, partial [Thermocrinis sp.]